MSAAAAKRTVLAAASILALVAVSVVGAAGGAPPDKDREAPSAPKNLRVSEVSQTRVRLAWDASSDNVAVAGYYVFGDRGKATLDTGLDTPQYTLDGLSCGQSSTLTVIAFDDSQNRSEKATMTVSSAPCTDTLPPATPAGFRQVATSENAVVLAWNPAADNVGVVGYGVYRNLQRVASPSDPTVPLAGLTCGSSYDYAVDAVDAAGNRSSLARAYVQTSACAPSPPPPPPATDTQAPSTPSGLAASSITQSALSLSWSPSTDNVQVTGYDLYRGGTKVASPASPGASQSGLACGTSYIFAVEALDAAGNRSSRASRTTSTSACSTTTPPPPPPPPPATDTQAPSTPSGLAASSITQSALTLSWSPSTDNVQVTGYDLYRGGTKVASPTSPGASQSGLACGTSYTFAVEALDAAGNRSSRASLTSSTSACSVTTPPPSPPPPPPTDTQPPSTPTGLGVSSGTPTSASLSWTPSTDNVAVAGYRSYRDGAYQSTGSQPAATISGLSCGTAYTFAVDAFDAEGNASTRASVIGSTLACPDTQAPTTPAGVVASSRTATSIALIWSASSDNVGVTGYGRYRGGSLVGTGTTTTGIFAGLTCNTNYTLAVDAVDAAGNRSAPSTVMVSTTACPDTTPPSAPTNLSASNVTQTGLTLSWNASTDNVAVTGYRVYRDNALVGQPTTTSLAVTGLACGTAATFAVEARDAAGNVSSQASRSVTQLACAAPAPPATWSGPITITQGGTYSGSWESTSASTPAVRVATSAPVTITGRVRNLAGGGLIDSPFGTGARVTIDHVSLYGGNGRGIEVENFNLLEVTNCTFDKTSGTYALNPLPGARVYIARNKVRNIQAGAGGKLAHAFQFNRVQGASSFVVEWNEVINTYGQSAEEDGISLYRSAGSTVRNNYLQGGYPASSSMSYTGTGILTDDIGSSGNTFHDNHVVGWTNVGIGITAGSGSVIRNNRVISDGRLDNGSPASAEPRTGIVIWNPYNDPVFGNNRAYGNVVGWMGHNPLTRDDWWVPGAANNVGAENTRLPDPIGSTTEAQEYNLWLAKVAGNGIQLGA